MQGETFNAPEPCPAGASLPELVICVQGLLDVFVANGFAIKVRLAHAAVHAPCAGCQQCISSCLHWGAGQGWGRWLWCRVPAAPDLLRVCERQQAAWVRCLSAVWETIGLGCAVMPGDDSLQHSTGRPRQCRQCSICRYVLLRPQAAGQAIFMSDRPG